MENRHERCTRILSRKLPIWLHLSTLRIVSVFRFVDQPVHNKYFFNRYDLRKKALGGSLEEYTCCQGYIWPMSSRAGQCGEKSSPECCLCLEACFCAGCSMSATRFLVMDAKNIKSDPCDNRIIRFNNWLQLISCVCQILALFDETFRDAADIIRLIAELVFCITMGCMTAQLYYEMDESKGPFAKAGHGAPDVQTMKV